MTRDEAIKHAQMHAKALPESYYAEPFIPHDWVISAIMSACNADQGADVREACRELRTAMGNPVISGTMNQTLHGQIIRAATDMVADGRRFRWLCEHPDWHFLERLCREFAADSSMEFLTEMRRVIDARRSIELDPLDEHRSQA